MPVYFPPVTGLQRVIATKRGANLNIDTDQAIPLVPGLTKYAITEIWATNVSTDISLGVAAGGFYTAASKGGTNLVGVGQLYTALTAATVILPLTLVAGIVTTKLTAQTLYLSLSVANGSAATADFYVIGVDLT